MFPGGESIREMQSRMVAALDAVVADHPGETVVVVSHADPIKAAIAHYTGMHLDLFQRIVVSPASVTVFELPRVRRDAREVQRHRRPRRAPPPAEPPSETEARPQDDDDRTRSSSTPSTRSAPARSASPAQRAFVIQARKESAQLTVLVEKEQVALLAAEAVAFLDRIADEYPRTRPRCPSRSPSGASGADDAAVPARLIGLGFDPERELVLIELRERRPTTTTRTTTTAD